MPITKDWGDPTRRSKRLEERNKRKEAEKKRPALDLSKQKKGETIQKESTRPTSPPPDVSQQKDSYGGIAGIIKALDQNKNIPIEQAKRIKRILSDGSYNAPLDDPKKQKTDGPPQEVRVEETHSDDRREGLSLPGERDPHATSFQTIKIQNYDPGGGKDLPVVVSSARSVKDISLLKVSTQYQTDHTEIELQRLKRLVNQTSELLQRSEDFDFEMVTKISELSEKIDKHNISRQEIQETYNEIEAHYLALGGNPTLLDERLSRVGSPVYQGQDNTPSATDYEMFEGSDTGSRDLELSTRRRSPQISQDELYIIQYVRDNEIPDHYDKLRRKLELASKRDNPNDELSEIIEEAQHLVENHQTKLDELDKLYAKHKEKYKDLNDRYDLELGEEPLKDQRKQLRQVSGERHKDFMENLEPEYKGYTEELDECLEKLQNAIDPESDRPDSFHEQDSKPKATEVSKPEDVFSEDEVKCTFAVERAVTLGYFEYWRRDGIEQPDTEEFRKAYHSALELVGTDTDTDDLTSQNPDHLNKINKIFKERVERDVEKDPQKFRLHLKQTLVDARNRIAWTDEFKEHFNIEENWVKDSIQKLGITSGNFDDGYIMLLTNESEISNDVVMSKKPMDEIIDSYQESATADEIVSTYEKFMRGKVGLDSIHSQLRDGIPVDNRPSSIWNREVTFVSGEKNNCVPHSLLKGAHPEWPTEFINQESVKAKDYVVEALKEKTSLYKEKVKEYMDRGSKHQEAKEQAANELEIFDVENLNIGSDDMLNPGGDTGRMLISYLRETRVKDPTSREEVPLLDPDRPVFVYQFRDGRMSCTTKVEPNYEEQPYNASSSYAILRHHEALHYYAILPQEDS